jgi:asparagine synthase (glutamine-hydrolysing)
MSPICGILNRNGKDVSAQMSTMMSVLGQKENNGAWLVANGAPQWWQEGSEPSTGMLLGQTSFNTREQPVERPSFSCRGNLNVLYEGNLYNREELSSYIQSNHELAVECAAEIVAHMLEENYRGDLAAALKLVVPELDGAYCLAASDGQQVIIMRDSAGLRPLFYAEDSEFMAFASLKTALWDIGLRNVKPVRAGMLITLNEGGVTTEEAQPLVKKEPKSVINDSTVAVDSYCVLLKKAVEKRLQNLNKVGVLVSGGVDSCLIAKIVSDIATDRGIEVTAYTAGVYGATDIEYAERFVQEFGLKHRVRSLNRGAIESYIPQVIVAVEERDWVQIEAGIGVYAALEMAVEDGISVIFSGQGPDELWGGYTWYPQVIASEGYEGLEQRMLGDLGRADIETLDRENRLAMAHGIEKVFPYIDTEVVRLAMSVSPRIKITSGQDRVGKRPHREASKRLGLPSKYADRSKDAAQHGTGIHDTLDAIARKYNFTPELVNRIGYLSELVSDEKLASSTRYGYQYAEKELWQTPEHVQFFLDALAYKYDLLNEVERTKIEKFLNCAVS